MKQWQGIEWTEGKWGAEEWNQLAQLLNSGAEFSMLGIQYPYLIYEKGRWYEIPRPAMPDAHWYRMDAIQRATYHEKLFSVFFKWEAAFSDRRKAWVWIRPPSENGEPTNARDFDTTHPESNWSARPYQPSVVQTSHGDLLRVGEDTISFPEYSYHIDPLVEVKCTSSCDGQVYGGIFMVPPDYGAKLFVNQIRNGDPEVPAIH